MEAALGVAAVRFDAIAALRPLGNPVLTGVVESDESYFRHCEKGCIKRGWL